jgi:hypothetical protein
MLVLPLLADAAGGFLFGDVAAQPWTGIRLLVGAVDKPASDVKIARELRRVTPSKIYGNRFVETMRSQPYNQGQNNPTASFFYGDDQLLFKVSD